jgi:hypothetical protein
MKLYLILRRLLLSAMADVRALVRCSVYVENIHRILSISDPMQVTMSKEEGAKTVVLGGRSDVQQQYCGTVGGQSTDFSTIDTEIKVRKREQTSSNLTDVE